MRSRWLSPPVSANYSAPFSEDWTAVRLKTHSARYSVPLSGGIFGDRQDFEANRRQTENAEFARGDLGAGARKLSNSRPTIFPERPDATPPGMEQSDRGSTVILDKSVSPSKLLSSFKERFGRRSVSPGEVGCSKFQRTLDPGSSPSASPYEINILCGLRARTEAPITAGAAPQPPHFDAPGRHPEFPLLARLSPNLRTARI